MNKNKTHINIHTKINHKNLRINVNEPSYKICKKFARDSGSYHSILQFSNGTYVIQYQKVSELIK